MSSRLDRLIHASARIAPRSVVARTTVAIVLLALLMGGAFAVAASALISHHEYARLETQLEQLLASMDNTLRIACYLNDRSLAKEVASGLLQSDAVEGVRIESGGEVLVEMHRSGAAARGGALEQAIQRQIRSPFAATQVSGRITLYRSAEQLRAQAWTYTRYTVGMLLAVVAVVATGVALVVFLLVTRPIKGISDELHRVRKETGRPLQMPPGTQDDEIGRLVVDVNELIGSLSSLLRAERNLRLQQAVNERKLQLLFEKTETGIFLMDHAGRLHSWNPAFVRMLGLGAAPPEGSRPRLREMLGANAERIDAMMRDCILAEMPCEADLEVRRDGGGDSGWIEVSLNPIGPQMLQGVINDITERKRSVAAAQQLAMRDEVTGLLNRRGLDAGLSGMLGGASRDGEPALAVLAVDLDHFKRVNDSHGHQAGDQVLWHVARVLENAVRRTDLVARTGGDEFVIALGGAGGDARGREVAAQVLAGIAQPIALEEGGRVTVGASIGIALSQSPTESAAELLHRADAAMYWVKLSGRGGIHLASDAGLPSLGRQGTA